LPGKFVKPLQATAFKFVQVAVIFKMAGLTGLEPATSCVTGTHSLLFFISGPSQALRPPANLAGAQNFYGTLISE
jgi:hypothetical protein